MLERKDCRFCGEAMPHTDCVCWGCSQDCFRERLNDREPAGSPSLAAAAGSPHLPLPCPAELQVAVAIIPRLLAAATLATAVFLGGYWLGNAASPEAERPPKQPQFTGASSRLALPSGDQSAHPRG